MENDDELVGTLLTRRQALAVAGRAGLILIGGAFLETASEAAAHREPARGPYVNVIASPSLTQGPFYVTEHLNRSDLRGGSTRPSIANAIPLALNFTLYAGANKDEFVPLPGAQVDVWHVDSLGVYSAEPQGLNPEDTEGQNFLRGYQTSDASGKAGFRTVFPGWYNGRTTHIHFKVHYLRDGKVPATFTSQLFVPDDLADSVYQSEPYRPRSDFDMHNDRDPVYRDQLRDGTRVGKLMTLDLKPASGGGYTADYAIAIVTHPHPPNGGRARRNA